MRGRDYLRLLVIQVIGVLALVLGASAMAEDYYWKIPYPDANIKYKSAVDACTANNDYYKDDYGAGYSRFEIRNKAIDESHWSCYIYAYKLDSKGVEYLAGSRGNNTTRYGTSCPVGTKYDPLTGGCQSDDACRDLQGVKRPFSKAGTAPDPYFTIAAGYGIPSQEGCFEGCRASTVDQKCTSKTTGQYFCRGTAVFSGDKCDSSAGGGVGPSDTSDYPDPQTTTKTDPCNYTTAADGTKTCTSTTTNDKEGQSCGTVNGQLICVNKKPNSDKTTVDTTIKQTTNPSNDKTTTKTDTATTTVCTGIKDCKTTSTTTTTTTVTGANGENKGTTTECKGDRCPDKNTNPDGDGDGFGDCVLQDCSEGGGGAGDWYQPGDDTYGSVLKSFSEQLQGVPVVSGIKNYLTWNPNGACPRYSVNAWVFNMQFDQWCTTDFPWALIASVIIGTACFAAFRIAFT
ncbi:hypothetical protein [Pseudomonas aeruginosa]|uniref:hypothetical protein n=1 Tax=Pseudomonas aeruginosa TaxID=287 RepID=UPI000AF15693|nr:hypothetical protein [Pseudomonas aeruginosa]